MPKLLVNNDQHLRLMMQHNLLNTSPLSHLSPTITARGGNNKNKHRNKQFLTRCLTVLSLMGVLISLSSLLWRHIPPNHPLLCRLAWPPSRSLLPFIQHFRSLIRNWTIRLFHLTPTTNTMEDNTRSSTQSNVSSSTQSRVAEMKKTPASPRDSTMIVTCGSTTTSSSAITVVNRSKDSYGQQFDETSKSSSSIVAVLDDQQLDETSSPVVVESEPSDLNNLTTEIDTMEKRRGEQREKRRQLYLSHDFLTLATSALTATATASSAYSNGATVTDQQPLQQPHQSKVSSRVRSSASVASRSAANTSMNEGAATKQQVTKAKLKPWERKKLGT